jgi:Cdc6-like AAA superfamily ATPase
MCLVIIILKIINMETSILISGKQGSGKTFRMNQIISKCKKSVVNEISPKAFLSLSSDKLSPKCIYVIDEVVDISQVLEINNRISQFDLKVVAATQLSSNELLSQPIENLALIFLH